MMASRSVRPLIPPKIGRTRLLPPAKPPALKPTSVVGENGRILAPSRFSRAAWIAARWAASSGRFKQAQGDQLRDRDRIGDDRLRHHERVGRMQANRRVEVQEPAELGRGGEDLALGGLDAGPRGGPSWVAARLASASRPWPVLA